MVVQIYEIVARPRAVMAISRAGRSRNDDVRAGKHSGSTYANGRGKMLAMEARTSVKEHLIVGELGRGGAVGPSDEDVST